VPLIGPLLGLVVFGIGVWVSKRGFRRKAAAAGLVLTLSVLGLVSAFVFQEDDYVADGGSRWAHRGSSEHVTYVVAMAIGAVLVVLYSGLVARGRRPGALGAALMVGGMLEGFGALLLILAFGSN
jgi:uncharacterized membrane protein YiaA